MVQDATAARTDQLNEVHSDDVAEVIDSDLFDDPFRPPGLAIWDRPAVLKIPLVPDAPTGPWEDVLSDPRLRPMSESAIGRPGRHTRCGPRHRFGR